MNEIRANGCTFLIPRLEISVARYETVDPANFAGGVRSLNFVRLDEKESVLALRVESSLLQGQKVLCLSLERLF